VPYGLTSAEALLPHFVAGETSIREAVGTSPLNSLEHPRYDFFYPWDYSIDRDRKIIENHNFIHELKRAAYPGFFASLDLGSADTRRLTRTLKAEDLYLVGFQQFLSGISPTQMYRIFDEVLSQQFDVHPNQISQWNTQLLERITVVFEGDGRAEPPSIDIKVLHAKIGELTLENDCLESARTKAGLLSAKR